MQEHKRPAQWSGGRVSALRLVGCGFNHQSTIDSMDGGAQEDHHEWLAAYVVRGGGGTQIASRSCEMHINTTCKINIL